MSEQEALRRLLAQGVDEQRVLSAMLVFDTQLPERQQ